MNLNDPYYSGSQKLNRNLYVFPACPLPILETDSKDNLQSDNWFHNSFISIFRGRNYYSDPKKITSGDSSDGRL